MLSSRTIARLAVIGGIAAGSALPLAMTADASTKVTRHVTVRISTQDQTIKHGKCYLTDSPNLRILVKANGRLVRSVSMHVTPARGNWCPKSFSYTAPKKATIKLYQRTSGGGWTFTSRLYRCGTHPRQTLFACYLDR
ncbi:hypothetical protein [Actinoallomurus rhizosphaericola]|uniref:hypothetical protein n=1 Tax=Actinoallomurus rhizosphaericola TaxID=2952536 RepID=UPI0020913775|nr:hypothetical protein [Actinoallomurus rhizosphaericola]MCO5994167.1 hypothetical protein [Actinoallomurus rhizosphaericola]